MRRGITPERRDEFLAWTTRVKNLLNPPAVVAWNSATNTICWTWPPPDTALVFFDPGEMFRLPEGNRRGVGGEAC